MHAVWKLFHVGKLLKDYPWTDDNPRTHRLTLPHRFPASCCSIYAEPASIDAFLLTLAQLKKLWRGKHACKKLCCTVVPGTLPSTYYWHGATSMKRRGLRSAAMVNVLPAGPSRGAGGRPRAR